MEKEYKGFNGTLVLTDTGIIIKRGLKGFLFGGMTLRGDKTIPYSSVAAVQLKKAGMLTGYIQLTLIGGSEAKAGLFQSTNDENTVQFVNSNDNAKFTELKDFIDKKIVESRGGHKNSDADDISKYADLRDRGIITEEEFQAKKKLLLGL